MRYSAIILVGLLVGCDNRDSSQARNVPAHPAPSDSSANPKSMPVVLIDTAHAMHPNQTSTKPYLSPASPGIILDGTQFLCHDPKNQGRTPNVVQVLYNHSEFKVEWPSTGEHSVKLDASTLQVLKGNRFTTFATGTHAIIAVGYRDDPNQAKSSTQPFDPFWVGSVLFQ